MSSSILVAQDCRSASSPYRGRFEPEDPQIPPENEVFRRQYLPVWKLSSQTDSQVAFSIPPESWFREKLSPEVNRLVFAGVNQLGVSEAMFMSKKQTTAGNWAITGLTQIGTQMFTTAFPMNVNIYAVPFVTPTLARHMQQAKADSIRGPVYVDEAHMMIWMLSLLESGDEHPKSLVACPVPWHPDLQAIAAGGSDARGAGITQPLLSAIFPDEKSDRLTTILGKPEAFRGFILSTEWVNRWKANFRVGRLIAGGAPRTRLQVELRIGH